MNNIPNEILTLILRELSGKDTLTCTEVCKRWRFIFYEAIGGYKNIGIEPNFKPHFLLRTKFQNIEEIQHSGIKRCVLSNIGDQNVPNFGKPFLLKSIGFYCGISRDNFNKLVTPLENLRILWLHITTLNQFKMEEGSIWLNFPKLHILSLVVDGMSHNSYNQFTNRELLLANISTILLDGQFPKLEELNLAVPDETSLFNPFSTFLTKHQSTLRRFEVEIIDRLNISDDEEQPEIVIPLLQIPGLRLTSIYLAGNQNHTKMWTFFNPIIQSQTSLRHYVNTTSYKCFIPDLIQNNAKTLVVLEILIKGRVFEILDFKVFADCTSLKSLFLIGNSSAGEKAMIKNTRYLPKSLQGIRIFNIFINSNDASDLATKEWDNLDVLELQYTGLFGEFGVPLPALSQLFALKRIKNVNILESVSIESTQHYYNYDGERDFASPEAIELRSRLLVDKFSGRFSLNDDQKYTFSDVGFGGNIRVKHNRVRACIDSVKLSFSGVDGTYYIGIKMRFLRYF